MPQIILRLWVSYASATQDTEVTKSLLWGHHSPNFWTSQSCSLWQSSNFFFECAPPFIDKLMVITVSAVASTWLLGLGSKLYPSNMQRMLNKDLTRFMQILSRVHQKLASERKTLLQDVIWVIWDTDSDPALRNYILLTEISIVGNKASHSTLVALHWAENHYKLGVGWSYYKWASSYQ